MRSARALNVLVAAGVATALAAVPAAAVPSAPLSSTTPSIADRFHGTQVEGTLVKTVIDYPAVVGSTELHESTPDAVGAHESSADTDYAVRIGSTDIPVENTNGTLSEIASGSQVTLNVALPSQAVASSELSTPDIAESAPLTEQQATAVSSQLTAPLEVTGVAEVTTAIDGATTTADATTVPQPATTGNHKVTVVIPQRAGAENRTLTQDKARALIGDASTYWSSQTRGKVTGFKITTIKTYTTKLSKKQLCAISSKADRDRLWAEAAKKSGYKQGARTHLIVLTEPCTDSASQALGVAEIGSSLSTGGRVITNDGAVHTLVHELGHNFSLGHANLRSIYEDYEEEYLGMFSPMSATVDPSYGSVPALDVAYQLKLGVLGSGQVTRVTGKQTIRLNSVTSTKGNRAAYFYDPKTGARTFIEYRSGTNFDASAMYLNKDLSKEIEGIRFGAGVRVYVLEESDAYRYNDTGTFAIPSGNSVLKTTLRAGEDFTHKVSGFKVSVKSASQDSAAITISVPKAKSVTKAAATASKYGHAATVKASVTTKVPSAGKLVATVNGKVVGSAKVSLKSGKRKVSIKLNSKLSVGSHKVKIRYSGDSAAKASSKTVTVTVKKSTPSIAITVKNAYYKASPVATVKVASGVRATGKVTLKVDGKSIATKTLSKGQASFKLSSKMSKGKHTIKVYYSGSKGFKATSKSKSFTISVKPGKISGLRSGVANVKLGSTYKDTFKVNHNAKLQIKSGTKWKTVKKLEQGTHVLSHAAKANPQAVTYRVVISGSSTVKAAVSKSITLKTVSN